MEIARLNAIIGGDIKPLTDELKKGEAVLTDFAEKGAEAFVPLNKNLSDAAIKALFASKSLKEFEGTLALLKAEQSTIDQGTAKWENYQVAIKGVEVELLKLKAIPPPKPLPPIISPTTIPAIEKTGTSLTKVYGSIKSLANILPGLGISGIFLLAFEAISAAVKELGLFEDKLHDISRESIADNAKELNSVNILVDELKSENSTRERKADIIKELQQIAPAYFGNLVLEGDTVRNLTDDYQKYARAIQLIARIKTATKLNEENVTKQLEEQIHTSERLALLESKRAYAEKGGVDVLQQRNLILDDQLQRQTELAKAARPYLDIIIQAQKELDTLGGDPNQKFTALNKSIDDAKEHLKKLIGTAIKFNDIAVIPFTFKFTPEIDPNAKGSLEGSFASIDDFLSGLEKRKALEKFNKDLALSKEIAHDLASIFVDMFQNLLEGKKVFDGIAKAIERMILQLLQAVIESLILRAVLAAISGGAATPLQIAVSKFAFFPHAEGGVFTQPTLWGNHLIGEKGPEALIPLSQLDNLRADNSQQIFVSGKISGSDIILVQNRQNVRNNRNFGANFN